jgi:hypothetical protein
MTDIGLSAFSIVFMGSPCFPVHQRALRDAHGGATCQTLPGTLAIRSDNYGRQMPITGLLETCGNIAEPAACDRARRKIKKETSNLLKTNGYNPEHNVNLGKKSRPSGLVILNLLALALRTTAHRACRHSRIASLRGLTCHFFKNPRTIASRVVSRTAHIRCIPSPQPPCNRLDQHCLWPTQETPLAQKDVLPQPAVNFEFQ